MSLLVEWWNESLEVSEESRESDFSSRNCYGGKLGNLDKENEIEYG